MYRKSLIENVLSNIRAKFPIASKNIVFIQQGNVSSHINLICVEYIQEAQTFRSNIQLSCGLPNSQDFNVLDLGFFYFRDCSEEAFPKNIVELVSTFGKAINALLSNTLEKNVLSLEKALESF